MAKVLSLSVVVVALLVVAGWRDGGAEARILKRDIQRDIPDVPLKPELPQIIEPKVEDILNEEALQTTEANISDPQPSDKIKNVDNNNEDDQFEQPEGRVLYSGSQLWKTVVDSEEKVMVLAKLRDQEDITMWGGNVSAIDILVKPNSVDKVKNILGQERINYDIAIDDLQRAIDEENPPPEKEEEDRNGYRLTWQSYHRVDDHHSYLDFLVDQYPDLVKVQTIGSSVHGRPIKVIKISNGHAGNKAIWVDGGIHAREWITPATVTYIINQFVTNWDAEPKYVQNIDWYFAPMLNPDGYEYTHMTDRLWRKNRRGSGRCAGVDLNRNFGYRWGGSGASKNPCAETYGGSGPFSEPETAAIQRFINGANAKWRAYISFHSYGQYILYPWGYSRVVPPDYRDLEMVGQRAAQAIRNVGGPSYTVGPAGNTLYPAAGGSDDWAKGTMKMKYSYTIELRDNGRYGFVLPASYILPTAKEGLAAVRVIAEAAYKA